MDQKINVIRELFDASSCETVRKVEPMQIGEWRKGGNYLYYRRNKIYIERYKIRNRGDAYSIAMRHHNGKGVYDIL